MLSLHGLYAERVLVGSRDHVVLAGLDRAAGPLARVSRFDLGD